MNIFNRYPVLIAEIGVNFYDLAEHECISNMEAAKYMIDEAKDCGITVVEFQSYKAESIVSLTDEAATESGQRLRPCGIPRGASCRILSI